MKTNDRAVKGYPAPVYAKLVKNEAQSSGQSVSAVVTAAIKARYDNMPPNQRERLLNQK